MKNRETMKKVWSKVTGGSSSYYSKMDHDKSDLLVGRSNDDLINKQAEAPVNYGCASKKDTKQDAKPEKKKRKGWKRLRHAALVTCRYIGMGVSHMSPISTYPVPDYNVDPYGWCETFTSKYHSGSPKPHPYHWTTGIVMNGW